MVKRCLLAFAMFSVALVVAFPSVDSNATSATPGATTTPMAEATVDDVTIRLLSVNQSETLEIVIELSNASPDTISVPQTLFQLQATLNDGSTVVRALRSSIPASCQVSPGQIGRMTLTFDTAEGQIPISLKVGIEEPYRTGAYVVFPLNSNDGPSAFGGSGISGGSANASVTPSASSSPVSNAPEDAGSPEATPANVCAN
ncbi:MAG: hypothetical protein ACRDHN_09960 [Thermomicrobiales bacterium]